MKTIQLNYLLSSLSLILLFGCVTEKQSSIKEETTSSQSRTVGNNTRTEICHNCQVTFKTTLIAQKMAINSPTHGFCSKCTAEYHKSHP